VDTGDGRVEVVVAVVVAVVSRLDVLGLRGVDPQL